MSLEIALLDVSGDHDDAPRNFRREFDVPLSVFDVPAGDLPDSGVDAAVLSGSWASVYWDLDWFDPLERWMRGAIDAGVPVLGVCFGHQFLADLLGGEVVGRDAYELGYHAIEHVPDSRLFAGVPRSFTAFTAHSDDVVALPPGARKLAENDHSLHAFRKDRVFGVQFHPEFDPRTAKRITADRRPSEERTPDAVETLTREHYDAAAETKALFDDFVEFVREVR